MSLMPRSRLISDSPGRRWWPTAAMRRRRRAARPTTGRGRRGRASGVATIMQAVTEPAKPSHDFFGLIDGAIGCLPNSTPAA